MGTYLEYLEDPQGSLTFEQASSPEFDSKFKAGTKDTLNFGLTDSVYWLRFRVRNDASQDIRWRLKLARPTMNTIILYLPNTDNSGYIEKKTGYVYPFSTRDIPSESFVFDLPIPSGSEELIYISTKDKSMELPFKIWSSDSLNLRDQQEHLIVGLSFGALIIMLVSNLFLMAMLRDKGFLFYSFFQVSTLLYLANAQGYVQRYLLPDITFANSFVIPLFVELGIISLLVFAGKFFKINELPRIWRIPYQVMLSIMMVSLLPTPFIGAKILDVVLPLGLLIYVYVPSLALYKLAHGYKPARFYLFSWTFFLITGSSAILERMGLFTVPNLIPEQAIQLGCVFLVTFQSLALADQFNLYKQETFNAQSALMNQQKEALKLTEALTQTLEHAREELEDKVMERTQALTEVNERLANEVLERERAQREAELLARVDPLTGLFNRRHFSHLSELEFKNALRYKHPISILIFDIDRFKKVNDTFGHQAGDKALVHVAEVFQQQARSSDVLARYGGEEFIALLPETDHSSARQYAERLRKTLQDSVAQVNGHPIPLTVSIGITGMEITSELENLEELLKEADEALYQAKRSGRNRVVVFDKQQHKK